MHKLFSAIVPVTIMAVTAFGPTQPATAQNLFETRILVNDLAITRYELEQRERMLTLFRAPGDPKKLAREQLIEDRLKLDAANSIGVVLGGTDIETGLTEFAGRFDMDTEQLVNGLESEGVSQESLREFVRIGITWREVIRARFVSRVSVNEEDLDRARAATNGSSGVRVLLSEIIIPLDPADPQAAQDRAERISTITSQAEFSAQARQFSATATRDNGGRLDWQLLTELPPFIRPIVLGLTINEVSDPLPVDGAIALFQLRNIEELDPPTPAYSTVEYAAYYIDGGRSEQALARAARVKAQVDVCDDLYGIAKGEPDFVLERGSKAPDEIPSDIAAELARLDTGEVSTALTRSNGQTLVFLMLCGRSTELPEGVEGPSDEELTNFIRGRRLDSFGTGYLEQLRSEARIIEK